MLTRARLQGYSIKEVGVRHRPRLKGKSTVSVLEVPRVLRRLIPFWWSHVLFAGLRSNSRGGLLPRPDPPVGLPRRRLLEYGRYAKHRHRSRREHAA
jgi:hypothetical protein